MSKLTKKVELRKRRKKRVRKKIFGLPDKPRLTVFRSSKHIYAQVIDDLSGHTIEKISSFTKGERVRSNVEGCKDLGKRLAVKILEKDIKQVVFDKNGYVYHGRIKALADGVREGGVKI